MTIPGIVAIGRVGSFATCAVTLTDQICLLMRLERLVINRAAAPIATSPSMAGSGTGVLAMDILLNCTSLPLPRIAAESGYNSHEHFTHTFRNKIGVAPGAYRRRYRDQRPLPSVRGLVE